MSGTTRQHQRENGATGRTHKREGGKMKKLLVAGLAILGSLGVVGTAGAITYEYGTPVPALQITTFSPGGIDMAGMEVTV